MQAERPQAVKRAFGCNLHSSISVLRCVGQRPRHWQRTIHELQKVHLMRTRGFYRIGYRPHGARGGPRRGHRRSNEPTAISRETEGHDTGGTPGCHQEMARRTLPSRSASRETAQTTRADKKSHARTARSQTQGNARSNGETAGQTEEETGRRHSQRPGKTTIKTVGTRHEQHRPPEGLRKPGSKTVRGRQAAGTVN